MCVCVSLYIFIFVCVNAILHLHMRMPCKHCTTWRLFRKILKRISPLDLLCKTTASMTFENFLKGAQNQSPRSACPATCQHLSSWLTHYQCLGGGLASWSPTALSRASPGATAIRRRGGVG